MGPSPRSSTSAPSGARTLPLVAIAGPTASGKSALALALAREVGGTVINCDSMQVYRDLRILTARPGADDEAAAPHRLYGHVDGAEPYSAGRYAGEASAAIARADAEGRLPILVGGTGLYFRALLDGLSRMPAVPEEIRARVRAQAQGVSTADLHAWLARVDRTMAERLMASDRQRILRALEVREGVGASLADFQTGPGGSALGDRPVTAVFLEVERGELVRRIETRFAGMLDAGALEEARAIGARGLDPALPVMRAHGLPWLLAHFAGTMTLAEAEARAIADTRRYAKRQHTFFRTQLPRFRWIAPQGARQAVLSGLLAGK